MLLPFRDEFVQGKGVIHGGIIGLIADTAGYFAAASVSRSLLATAQFGINILAPARDVTLVATGRVLSSGRRLVVCELRVRTEDGGSLVAAGQGTYAILG